MMKFAFLVLWSFSAAAYVPTVESLFRHGGNPEVSVNGISATLVVKRLQHSDGGQDSDLLKERAEDFYKLFFTKSGETLKVSQTRYNHNSFSEGSLEHRSYLPNLSPHTFKTEGNDLEKGLLFSALTSIFYNNGHHAVTYLKSIGAPVRLNSDLINREKVELLADYKRYLIATSKDRNARKTESNPLQPADDGARARAENLMNESMYIDTKQVKLSRDDTDMVWLMAAGTVEATFSYKDRDLLRLKYKGPSGEVELLFKDYWLANGTHRAPRYIVVKGLSGESYQVELINLRHMVEKDDDVSKRLKKWDELLKGKSSTEYRPAFLL